MSVRGASRNARLSHPAPDREPPATSAEHRDRPRVLVVDDNPEILSYFADALDDDFDVFTASTAAAGLDLVHQRCIDVVLLDVVLPGMDGLEVLRRLRVTEPPPEVIVVSGLDNARVAVTALQYGAADYVTKPFDGPKVRAMILDACERRRASRAPTGGPFAAGHAKVGIILAGTDIGRLAPVALALGDQVVTRLACDPHVALTLFAELTPELVVIEPSSRPGEWIGLVRTIEASARRCPVLVTAPPTGVNAFDLGPSSPDIVVVPAGDLDDLLERIGSLCGARGDPLHLPRYRPAVVRALRFMSSNYAGSLSVADIARASGLSARRLAEVFQTDAGSSVMEHLKRIRVEVARSRLASDDTPLGDIARRCGFSDSSHLSRVFLEAFGERPGQYRARRSPPAAW